MAKRTAKRGYDAEATRKRILDAAAEAFQVRGYHATSMHDLMQSAGVPGGSMYHHFPTKKSLALAVIDERVAPELRATWIDALDSSPRAADAILGIFAEVAASIERRRGAATGCPVGNLAVELVLVDRDFRNALDGLFRLWGDAVRDRLLRDARTETERDRIPALSTTIVAAFSGAMTLAKTARSPAPLLESAAGIEALLKHP